MEYILIADDNKDITDILDGRAVSHISSGGHTAGCDDAGEGWL